jgi:hypothetical protein
MSRQYYVLNDNFELENRQVLLALPKFRTMTLIFYPLLEERLQTFTRRVYIRKHTKVKYLPRTATTV